MTTITLDSARESGAGTAFEPLLRLEGYDRDLCERLALSPKTERAVKRAARLCLELARSDHLHCASARTGVSVRVLRQMLQECHRCGVTEVLARSQESAPPPLSTAVTLTAAERAFCERVVALGDAAKGRTRRARVLLALADGQTKAATAASVGVSERTLERLIERYQARGVEGTVNDAGRLGRPVLYAKDEYVPLIQRVVQQQQPSTLLGWTVNDLRAALSSLRQEAAQMSPPTLRVLIREAGIRFRVMNCAP